MAHIVIIDDEKDILVLVKNILESAGHLVTVCSCAEEYLSLSQGTTTFDLILLDVMMPQVDGFIFCKQIREKTDCPILFLTAKTKEEDLMYGLGIGADDYIKKPFHAGELKARIEAHLRREHREKKHVFVVCGIEFHLAAKEIYIQNEKVMMTPIEYNICEFLARNQGRVFSKDQIYDEVSGYLGLGDSFTIAVHVKNIRAKFEKYGKTPITTVWGIGYKWQEKEV